MEPIKDHCSIKWKNSSIIPKQSRRRRQDATGDLFAKAFVQALDEKDQVNAQAKEDEMPSEPVPRPDSKLKPEPNMENIQMLRKQTIQMKQSQMTVVKIKRKNSSKNLKSGMTSIEKGKLKTLVLHLMPCTTTLLEKCLWDLHILHTALSWMNERKAPALANIAW